MDEQWSRFNGLILRLTDQEENVALCLAVWLNRVTNMVDAVGTTVYTYTAGNQLLTEDGPFASDTVTNAYSNRLRTKLNLQQPTGVWTNLFVFDAARRLTNVTSPVGTSSYSYRAGLSSLQPARISLPNTSYITNSYDSVARLLSTYLKNSGNSSLDYYLYSYNQANERTGLTRADSSTVGYSYDKIGQLTFANSSVSVEDVGYAYDSAWNLIRRTNVCSAPGFTDTFTVDNKNELTNAYIFCDYGNHDATYDANGNLTMLDLDSEAFIKAYFYDDENRLIFWTLSYSGQPQNPGDGPLNTANLMTQFVYDGLGRLRQRVEYADNGSSSWDVASETEYVYDGWRVIQERDVNNTPTVSYTRGNDLSGSLEGAGGIGGVLARSDGYSGGNWTSHNYYFADGNGNVTYMLNGSQSMVADYRYDPFGNLLSSSGTLADANVYRFSSKEFHVNSGMYYYGYRFYDPNLQRWINADPIGEPGFEISRMHAGSSPIYAQNPYLFIQNDPTDKIDSQGLSLFEPEIGLCTPGEEAICRIGCAIQGQGYDYCRRVKHFDLMRRAWITGIRCHCKPKMRPKQCIYHCGILRIGGIAVPDIRSLPPGGTGCCLPSFTPANNPNATCALMGAIY